MSQIFDLFKAWLLHLDTHLLILVGEYGSWVYLILFLVIFIETGVIVMPFLPGDSLLFIAGALAAKGWLDPLALFGLLFCAAVAGNALNFSAGRFFERRALDTSKIPFVKREHLLHTQQFFAVHGGKTVILARFVPIVRTLAPFVAALGSMPGGGGVLHLQRGWRSAVVRQPVVGRLPVWRHPLGRAQPDGGGAGHRRAIGAAGGDRLGAHPQHRHCPSS